MYNANTDSNGGVGSMEYIKVPLPKYTGHRTHPFLNKDNHHKLLSYLQQRLVRGMNARDATIDRLCEIDKNVSGWMRLSDEDKKRQQAKQETGIPQAIDLNLPLAFVHLDDMMTYFAQTFSPNRGMFYHTGKPGEIGEAEQIVTLMNNHAIYAGYFREILQALYSILKYNKGGFCVTWGTDYGPKLVVNDDTTAVETVIRWQGNKMKSIDMYNFFPDPTPHPSLLHCEGEFSATAEMRSHYWVQDKASRGLFFNCEDMLNEFSGSSSCKYYRNPPEEALMGADESGGTDWKSVLMDSSSTNVGGFELVEIYVKLNPVAFGLIEGNQAMQKPRDRLEMWRFTILNDERIIDATYANNIHGYLPHFIGVLNDDAMGPGQKSTAEILQPLQDFASFLMNVHVRASRKQLWGLTLYDPTAVDLKQIPKGEVAAKVAVKPSAYGRDLREFIWESSSNLETKQTLQDLDGVMGIINQFFPTQSLPSQIASIDRAVDSQVAAVQQGANRRQQKSARQLDDSLFRHVRFAMYYNIIQYQKDKEQITDFYTNKPIEIDLEKLRQTDLPFIIGQGLKAIDRQAAASSLQQIIFALIQAPQASQGIDMLGLIDYWTSMIDIDIDMKQFELQQQPAEAGAAPTPEDNAIAPATNPQAITTPLYG